MPNVTAAIRQLQAERSRLTRQLERINKALAALGGKAMRGKRRLSTAALARIRAAQKARWAKWRKAQKKAA